MTLALEGELRACRLCDDLPLGPRPIFQMDRKARILIAGQAPGRITHAKGIPFDDPSGVRLRAWLGVERADFYDPTRFAILPMGFCFPGQGKGGDLPPRDICARHWRQALLGALDQIALTLVIGRYAIDWHCPEFSGLSVGEAVKRAGEERGDVMVLPHPSPRNNRWLKNNPWFEEEHIPRLQARVAALSAL